MNPLWDSFPGKLYYVTVGCRKMYCLAPQQQLSRQLWITQQTRNVFRLYTQKETITLSLSVWSQRVRWLLCRVLGASGCETSSVMGVVLTMHLCSDSDTALPPAPAAMATEPSCCMCNCKSTLQAILLELRTMRKLIQTQRGKSYVTTPKLI